MLEPLQSAVASKGTFVSLGALRQIDGPTGPTVWHVGFCMPVRLHYPEAKLELVEFCWLGGIPP